MASPISNMGFVHSSGQSPLENEGLATPDYSCQQHYPHFRPAVFVTSYYETTPQHSTAAPIDYMQLFHSDPFFLTLVKPSKSLKTDTLGPPASPADPPRFSSSNESHWNSVARWETNGTDLSPEPRPVATYYCSNASPR